MQSKLLNRRLLPGILPARLPAAIFEMLAGPTWCFTDAACTTPAAVTDTVKGWRDTTGLLTFSNASATTITLQQDAGGKYYLDFGGGGNGYLTATTPSDFSGPQTGGTLAVGYRPSASQVSASASIVIVGDNSNTGTFLDLGAFSSGTSAQGAGVGGAGVTTSTATTITFGSDYRVIGLADPTNQQRVRNWRNGVEVSFVARTAAMPTTTGATMYIGTNPGNISSRNFWGRIYTVRAFNTCLTDAQSRVLDARIATRMP